MRSPRTLMSLVFSSLISSLIAILHCRALGQSRAKRYPFVGHEAFAAPAAFGLRHPFEITQDAALEVIDFGKATRQQVGAGLFAADATGAEHRDAPVFCRIEMPRGAIPELAKTRKAGIDRALEGAERHPEGVPGAPPQRTWRFDQCVPVGRPDIVADLPGRTAPGTAQP